MKTNGNTILITGGATGIGFSLAESFMKQGNTVIICGRREDKLKEAQQKLPGIHIKKCDISKEKDRKELHEWVSTNFKDINVLVNNAGVQRAIDLKKGVAELLNGDDEIETNLTAQIHLATYFIPELSKQKESAIINVSSGLGFVPLAMYPIYCATKAALHSFSISLRHQLKDTSIKVFELIPPIVDTELDHGMRASRGVTNRGIHPSEVAIAALDALQKDQYEISVGATANWVSATKEEREEAFRNMNNR